MPRLRTNGLEIEYDTFGEEDADPILLIMGLGTQMIAWEPPFCQRLANAGHFVIRFDNRDVGLSSKLDGVRAPGPFALWLHRRFGWPVRFPYSLADMALDAVGVLDALDLEAAHVIGASMGGMIAQLMAVSHSDRTKTLTSIMSSSGDRRLPGARGAVRRQLLFERPKSKDLENIVEHSLKSFRMIESPGYRRSDEELRSLVLEAIERSLYPQGFIRQLAAIVADGSRVERLKTVDTPTLVIHGKQDALVPVECGFDTALHIRGAKLELVDGMGHDIPPGLFEPIASLILDHVKRAGRRPDAAHPRPDRASATTLTE